MAGCWHVVCRCCVRAAGHASEAHAHQLEQQLDAANLAKAQLAREVRHRELALGLRGKLSACGQRHDRYDSAVCCNEAALLHAYR